MGLGKYIASAGPLIAAPASAGRTRLPLRPGDICQNVDELPNGHHPRYRATMTIPITAANSQNRSATSRSIHLARHAPGLSLQLPG